MDTTDPRAAGFNAAKFRDAIKFAMNMGTPERVADRATFRWTIQRTYAVADVAGKPYDYKENPNLVVAPPDVQVPVGVRIQPPRSLGGSITDVGGFDNIRAVITVMDVDYALVQGADRVILGQNEYDIEFVAPPNGLFGVTAYDIYCVSRDES